MAPRRKRTFGEIQERRNTRTRTSKFYPRYVLPGAGDSKARFSPGMGFDSYDAAAKWLDAEKALWDKHVAAGTTAEWTPPQVRLKAARAASEHAALTVKDLCERWLGDGHLKGSTQSSHRNKLRNRVYNTSIANMFVVQVDKAAVRSWWAEVQKRWPDTDNSNANAYKRLHTAFSFAVEQDIVVENPVQVKGAGDVPRSANRDKALISREEAKAMTEAMSERYRVPLRLLLWGGFRLGEMLELRRKDLVGLAGEGAVTVRVRRTAQRLTEDGGKDRMVSFDTPKTQAGNRDVTLPVSVSQALRKHVKDYMAADAGALVCVTSKATQVFDTQFRRTFNNAAEAAGRKDVTPHDCRRFYGTMLVTNGVDFESARRLMGHETVEQLMEYQRVTSDYRESAAAVLDGLM